MIIKSVDNITMKEKTLTSNLEISSVSLSRRSITLTDMYGGSTKDFVIVFSNIDEMETFVENLSRKINHENFT
jgi:hypothetical protein